MGRAEVERIINSLLVAVETEDYQGALDVLKGLEKVLADLSPQDGRKLYLAVEELQRRLKLKEGSIHEFLSNREKVRSSYLKCSS